MASRKPAKRARQSGGDSDGDEDAVYAGRSAEPARNGSSASADKDTALRSRMYMHEADVDLAAFTDRFWRHQITLAERDYDDSPAVSAELSTATEDAADMAVVEEDDEVTRRAQAAPPLTDFKKSHTLPLARIKKVMKLDPEVKMIATEVPILFARACETFIAELTTRAWIVAQSSRRKTIARSDITGAVEQTPALDFLRDIVDGRARQSPASELDFGEDAHEPLDGSSTYVQPARPMDVQAAMTEEHAADDELLAMANGGDHEGHGLAWESQAGPFAAAAEAGSFFRDGA